MSSCLNWVQHWIETFYVKSKELIEYEIIISKVWNFKYGCISGFNLRLIYKFNFSFYKIFRIGTSGI